MRNPHHVHCGADAAPVPPSLCLNLGSRADEETANVYLEIERLRLAVWRAIPAVLHDLIEIACYVYAADQTVVRGGLGVPEAGELGVGWRRELHLHIPVRHPEVWGRADVLQTLTATLSFLSDDDYEFHFRPMNRRTPLQAGLSFTQTPYDGVVEEVMLFSGGLDSLSGAVQEVLLDGRKVMLVHHRSTEKLTARHTALLGEFERLAKTNRPIHVPVWMNKEKGLGKEFTQRTRSFVYLALAATLAAMVGRDRVRFYENGVVSLNLPLSAHVVGARATRTTHPAVLNGYARLVSLLIDKPFVVENPFLWETKTQIVERIAAAGGGPLIGLSTSCAHTWTRTIRHPHCGICSQCIDRRFAILAAGQAEHDPADHYAVDLMTGRRDEGEERLMLAGFLERANRLEGMTEAQFFAHYGQTSRMLRQIPGSAEDAARRIYALYHRHAGDVARVVDQGIQVHSREIRLRTLDPTCLLRLVADPAQPCPPSADRPEAAAEVNVFRRRGQLWEVRFAGGRAFHLLPTKGAAYLHHLLGRSGQPISAIELAYFVNRNRSCMAPEGKCELLDSEAVAAYQARLLELREERQRAAREQDGVVLEEVDREVAQIEKELTSAVSPQGQVRTLAGARERVRKALGNAIRRTIQEIDKYDKTFATHLAEPTLLCGHSPRYSPDTGVVWCTE